MTIWDVVNNLMASFPFVAAVLVFLIVAVALVVVVVGFSNYGISFFKYGFKQSHLEDLGSKIDVLDSNINSLRNDLDSNINSLRAEFHGELVALKTNHFGHLKNFLSILTGVLLDKNLIDNETKARLENELRGM
jgi:predicted PurR-regulated permease PerM